MKVTVFIGSARKKYTYQAAEQFLLKLKSLGNIDSEIVLLSHYQLKTCIGCKVCFDRGEELCPLKDDRNELIDKMLNSDGVILASPNYSFQVSGLMKVFLDRLGFLFHRPRFFGKAFSSIVAQGIYGGKNIVRYFNFIGKALGFNVVPGRFITTLEPLSEKIQQVNDRILDRQSQKFYLKLIKKEYPPPSLFDLMIFALSRSSMKMMLEKDHRDFIYYSEKGWFQSDFYYPVKLNLFKKILSKLFDMIAVKKAK